eukprot:206558_1
MSHHGHHDHHGHHGHHGDYGHHGYHHGGHHDSLVHHSYEPHHTRHHGHHEHHGDLIDLLLCCGLCLLRCCKDDNPYVTPRVNVEPAPGASNEDAQNVETAPLIANQDDEQNQNEGVKEGGITNQ